MDERMPRNNNSIPQKLLITNQKIKEKISKIKTETRNPSPRNQNEKRKLALYRVDLFIHNMRQLSTQSESYLKAFFDRKEDNFYYLKEGYFEYFGIKKMIIEDKKSRISLRELEIDL